MINDKFGIEFELDKISKILTKKGLGYLYDFEFDRDNGLILPFFFAINMDFCIKSLNLTFVVNTDQEAQAGILYKEKLIFISFGLFDCLCKLSEVITASGLIDNNKGEFRYRTLHSVNDPFIGFSDDIMPFNCEDKNSLFLFIFDILLCFILYHELGHFENEHHQRFDIKNNKLLDDVMGHSKISKENALASHSREIVADNYSFIHILNRIAKSLPNENSQRLSFLNEFNPKNKQNYLALFIICCYFKMMDGDETSNKNQFELSHPLAAFRAKSILCMYTELNWDNDEEVTQVIQATLASVDQVFTLLGDNDSSWMKQVQSSEMAQWFTEICNEYPKWSLKA